MYMFLAFFYASHNFLGYLGEVSNINFLTIVSIGKGRALHVKEISFIPLQSSTAETQTRITAYIC